MKEHMEFNGNHLIELGYRPAKWFKEAIAYIMNINWMKINQGVFRAV
jgi:hypothetical protein